MTIEYRENNDGMVSASAVVWEEGDSPVRGDDDEVYRAESTVFTSTKALAATYALNLLADLVSGGFVQV